VVCDNESVKRKSLEISIIFGLVTLVQLITQIIVVRLFGASFAYDSFLVAVALPTVLISVIYSTLNDTFMPQYASQKDDTTRLSYARRVTTILVATSAFLALLFTILIPLLGPILFASQPADLFAASIPLFSVMIWALPVAVAVTIWGSVAYYRGLSIHLPFAQLLGAVASLLVTISLYPSMGIWALVYGFVVNIIAQLLIIHPKFGLTHLKPTLVIPLVIAWIPLIISNFALKSDILLMRSFATSLGEGYLVYLNLITKMYAIGSSIVTIGIQVLLLPNLLDKFRHNQYTEAIRLVNRTKLVSIALSILTSFAILIIGPILIRTFFVGGKFALSDYYIVRDLFPIFLIPSFAWGLNNIFIQPLIAIGQYWALGIANVVVLIIAWLVTMLLSSLGLGIWSISIGLSVLLFGSIIVCEMLWQKAKTKLQS
jgi:peptidoglycan biosynthesis protein MviN/MurJ (putative lipid II flippase)